MLPKHGFNVIGKKLEPSNNFNGILALLYSNLVDRYIWETLNYAPVHIWFRCKIELISMEFYKYRTVLGHKFTSVMNCRVSFNIPYLIYRSSNLLFIIPEPPTFSTRLWWSSSCIRTAWWLILCFYRYYLL